MTIRQAPPTGARLVEDAREWDAIVASSPGGHILQSFAWGEFKAEYGWKPERLAVRVDGGEAAAQVLWRRTPLGAVGYVPRGPLARPAGHTAATAAILEEIHRRARARRALFLKIEPNERASDLYLALGFHTSPQTIQPRATLVVDLDEGLDTVAARQHSKTRYNIRLAARKGVTVRTAARADVPAFQALMEATGQRDGFTVRPTEYYDRLLGVLGDQAELLLAEHEGDLLAALLVTYYGDEAVYLYGASANHKRNLMPAYLLQWEAMQRAAARGCARYDFWGIPPEMADREADAEGDDLPEAQAHSRGDLWGVYRFKRGFGGRLAGYSGAVDYVYGGARYWAWTTLAPRLQSMLRRSRGMGE